MSEHDDGPETPALEAWMERHRWREGPRDWPKTNLWFPSEAPQAVLHLRDRGCHQPPVLRGDPERPTVDVRLGSAISVGGYLSDMEDYFAAVLDAIRLARRQADRIAAQMAEEASSGEGE